MKVMVNSFLLWLSCLGKYGGQKKKHIEEKRTTSQMIYPSDRLLYSVICFVISFLFGGINYYYYCILVLYTYLLFTNNVDDKGSWGITRLFASSFSMFMYISQLFILPHSAQRKDPSYRMAKGVVI